MASMLLWFCNGRQRALFFHFVIFIAFLLCSGSPVHAWSSPGAYSIAILPSYSLIPGSPTYRVLYETPAGEEAVLSLTSAGSRIVGGSIHPSESSIGLPTDSLAAQAAASLQPHTALPSFLMVPPAQVANLTDEWEVLAKPATHSLLHCRIPYPMSSSDVDQREAAVLAQHGPAMAAALHQWWLRKGGPSSHGDGEGAVTGVQQWYVVCPESAVYRVNRENFWRAFTALVKLRSMDDDGEEGEKEEEKEQSKEGTLPRQQPKKKMVSEEDLNNYQADHFYCGSPTFKLWQTAARESTGSPVFEKVGLYDEEVSRPQWNAVLRSWEVWYPSTEPCSELKETGQAAGNHTATKAGSPPSQAPLWRSRVLFKCYGDRGGKTGKHHLPIGSDGFLTWSVTSVRQRCLVDIEISSDLVCLWDDYIDQLRWNPIPCVEMT